MSISHINKQMQTKYLIDENEVIKYIQNHFSEFMLNTTLNSLGKRLIRHYFPKLRCHIMRFYQQGLASA